jgi:hypothetical protein
MGTNGRDDSKAAMKRLGRLLFFGVGVVGWCFLLWIVGCEVNRGYTLGEKEVRRITSPDGKYDAILVRHRTAPLQLSLESICIVPAGNPIDPKQTIFGAHALQWSAIEWTSERELKITHPAFESIIHYEPIWPRYSPYNTPSETIRIVLNIDYEKDTLNKAVHAVAH